MDADLEALSPIDVGYAVTHGVAEAVNLATLRFFGRSGHSFVAESVGDDGEAACGGFVLAQAVWSGQRPSVHVTRLAAAAVAPVAVRSALVKALVKSAYDAGVYDLSFRTPRADPELREALAAEGFLDDDHVTMQLVLGERGQAWAEARRG